MEVVVHSANDHSLYKSATATTLTAEHLRGISIDGAQVFGKSQFLYAHLTGM